MAKQKKGFFSKIGENVKGFFRTVSYMSDPDAWLRQFFYGRDSASSVAVNEKTALAYTVFWACIKVISESFASTPIILYEQKDNISSKAKNHPQYNLLHSQPNPEMTAYQFKEMLMGQLLIYGNIFINIVRDSSGYVKELWPLLSWKMRVRRDIVTQQKIYQYTLPNNEMIILNPKNILHITGIMFDGIQGEHPILYSREAIGLGLAAEEYGNRFFANDARPGGIIEVPGRLSAEASARLRISWENAHKDLENKHRVAILEEGTKFKEVGLSPELAQFLETRKFQISEIARFFRIPPHLIGDLDKATFSNIEQQSIEFTKYTMLPHFVKWEQAFNINLLTPADQKLYYYEFMMDGLLRGDIDSRYKAYRIAREIGVMNSDEIRKKENMNPIEDGTGQIYYVPSNWMKLGLDASTQPQAQPTIRSLEKKENKKKTIDEIRSAKNRYQLMNSYREIYRDIMQRLIMKETKDLRQIVQTAFGRRDLTNLNLELEKYYSQNGIYQKQRLIPIYNSIKNGVEDILRDEIDSSKSIKQELSDYVDTYSDSFLNRYNSINKTRLNSIITKSINNNIDIVDSFDEEFDNWEKSKADTQTQIEVNRSSNAFAKKIYSLSGILRLMWMNFGSKTCPFCNELNGKIINIKDNFALSGSVLESDIGNMEVYRNTSHPPIHTGCVCQITSA